MNRAALKDDLQHNSKDEALDAFDKTLPPGELLPRAVIAKALGESPQTLANRQSLGLGFARTVRIGRRVFHYRQDVLSYVRAKLIVEDQYGCDVSNNEELLDAA